MVILFSFSFLFCYDVLLLAVADPDIPFTGGGYEIRLNAKGTVRSFGGRK